MDLNIEVLITKCSRAPVLLSEGLLMASAGYYRIPTYSSHLTYQHSNWCPHVHLIVGQPWIASDCLVGVGSSSSPRNVSMSTTRGLTLKTYLRLELGNLGNQETLTWEIAHCQCRASPGPVVQITNLWNIFPRLSTRLTGTLKLARQKPPFLLKQGLKNGEKNQLTPINERVHCTPMDGERWLAGNPMVDDTESDRPENFV